MTCDAPDVSPWGASRQEGCAGRRVAGPGGFAADPLYWAGSADLRTVAGADGFAVFPAGDREYAPGEVVDFLRLG